MEGAFVDGGGICGSRGHLWIEGASSPGFLSRNV
jgi:hypothetical protein